MMKSRFAIVRTAFPIILANATVPLLGLADTAAIGHSGRAQDLGAIALGALVFSFVYWGFGFLRMGTTGFVAQASGAGDDEEVRSVLLRAGAMGLGIGILLLLVRPWIGMTALNLLDASEAVKEGVHVYFYTRIWGAPATLLTFALMGVLIGLGKTRHILLLQLVLNGINIALNVWFVVGLGWGVRGIAAGTVIAEWTAMLVGSWMVYRVLRKLTPEASTWSWSHLFHPAKFVQMLTTNGNIMVRTLALLLGFAWFANQGARFGDTVLAANHVLLQFVSFSAFFLDGYAYVVEMMVGKAVGARDEDRFRREFKQANQVAGVTALVLALLFLALGSMGIKWLTSDAGVREVAQQHLPLACLYILVSFYAFQLDGVFIGATQSAEMRNASLFSFLIFIALGSFFTAQWANTGLWLAFIAYVIVRGLSLRFYLPRMRALFRREHHA